MKKLVLTITAAFLLTVNTVNAEMAIGITANFATVDTDGSETLRDSAKVTNASASEDVVVPEVFIEVIGDRGAFGVAYIPVQEIGTKSRTDTAVRGQDGGTYTAKAEVSSHIMLYADINMTEFSGQTVYGKLGISNATIKTDESLNSGSSYADEDVMGYTVGLGVKGSLDNLYANTFYKLEGTYTDYDDYESNSSANNKIVAETEITSVKASIGYNF